MMLLHDPRPRGRLALETPETPETPDTPETDRRHRSLPELAPELAEECRLRARPGRPVFVPTHSTDFLNGAEFEENFSLDKTNGVSTARRAFDDERLRSLHAEGDLPGARWRPDLFPGAELD